MNKYNIDQEVIVDGRNYFIIAFRSIMGTYQYSLSNTKQGEFHFACGEFSIEGAVKEDENNHQEEAASFGSLGIGLPEENESVPWDQDAATMNTMASSMRQSIDGSQSGYGEDIARMVGSSLFFKPSRKMVKWLIEYADGRMIIDVGAGQGHLVRMIKQCGGKAIGLEPNFDHRLFVENSLKRYGTDFDVNEMLAMSVGEAKGLINGMGKGGKAILVFARPCHSNFVAEGIQNMPDEMEALYITVPENLHKYQDLGDYDFLKKKLEHKGVSEDSEVVYSIKKQ